MSGGLVALVCKGSILTRRHFNFDANNALVTGLLIYTRYDGCSIPRCGILSRPILVPRVPAGALPSVSCMLRLAAVSAAGDSAAAVGLWGSGFD